MKKSHLILVLFLLSGLLLVPFTLINGKCGKCPKVVSSVNHELYNEMHLDKLGLKLPVFNVAIAGYTSLLSQNSIGNPGIIAIADLSQPSTAKRLYVIDLVQHKLLYNTWVAHGKNTGENLARGFSNNAGSLKSSLGFYLTGESYNGQHGISLRLHGMEPGYNDKAYERAIVIHGADYVNEQVIRQTGRLGRSFGCPAVSSCLARPIISALGEGSVVFIYYPDKNYLTHSKLAMIQYSN
ncbi:MAG TPA: murein L,D-transpeptidase catalytic domain family protein [Bacteroidia bacterium]|nr:murein L,D-transpeptidase catalytic domain family protein [Bacteroidia bacterium]